MTLSLKPTLIIARRGLLSALGLLVVATVALLIYSVAVDDAPKLCRDFAACGSGSPAP